MNQDNIYRGLEAEYHEQLWNELAPDDEVGLFLEHLDKTSSPWLEIGSGTGRILAPIHKSGQAVEGIEPSAEMCATAKEALPDIAIHETTLEDFEPASEASYGAVLFTAFVGNLLPDLDKALQKAGELLEPKGSVALTQFIPWAELSGEAPEGQWYTDQKLRLKSSQILELRTKHQIQRQSQTLTREHKYIIKNLRGHSLQSYQCKQHLRWYYWQELTAKLEAHGFENIQTFWNLASPELDEDASVFTVVATKK